MYKRGVRASHIDQGRHSRFPARVLQRPGLTKHFTPQRNIKYEIYLFRQARQNLQETLDMFATRLRQLASSCEFASV